MANLILNTVELVSTLRPAPENGAPSSEDYNDCQSENLLDLNSIVAFINNVLNPMFKSLPDTAIAGLEGRSIYGDLTDQTNLFYNATTSESLSIADSLRFVNSIVSSLKNAVTANTIQVGQLQQKLSSTNQNDIALTLQNLTNSLNITTNQQTATDAAISEIQSELNGEKSLRTTLSAVLGEISNVVITWPTAYLDNNYTVNVSIENNIPTINLLGFQYQDGGVGITVYVNNTGSSATTIKVHVTAKHD